VIHQYVLGSVWYYIASRSPTVNLLFDAMIEQPGPFWHIVLYAHDFLINILLAFPLAVMIVFITGASRVWIPTALAVVAGFAWSYRGVLLGLDATFFVSSAGAFLGVAMTVLSLPIAVAVLCRTWLAHAA
jgi:hypothetical protein